MAKQMHYIRRRIRRWFRDARYRDQRRFSLVSVTVVLIGFFVTAIFLMIDEIIWFSLAALALVGIVLLIVRAIINE
ncbi:MAG: hypothetical protein OEM52_07770 [bacterium]|nr:hypothetical protein [bacterium]